MKKTKTDALIIGSGVGGLCLAARLVQRGLKVIVAEKLPYLGGRFSSRKFKGYEISTGAMMVPYGEASAYQEAFDMVGASMRIREAKGGFRFRLNHGDYDTPIDGVDLAALLGFAMQDEAEAIKLGGQFMRSVLWSPPEDTISMRDWLAQYTDNQEIQNHYQGFCGAFTGINSNEVSAAEVFCLMKAMGVGLRYGIAINGNVDLMNALGDGIRAKGGEVRVRAACKGIMVDQDRVTGALVETEGSEEIIEADYVISNTGPSMTVELAGESYFEKSYLKRLRDFSMTTPVVHVCIASREPLCDFDGIINFGNTRRLVFFETPTLTCPELAPPDMHFATTYSVPQYTAGPLKLKETIEMIMLDLKDNFSSFTDAELLMVATHHGEWPAMRRWPGYPMPVKTPVQNLFNVGDGCMPKGTVGIEACALSAREVAQEIAG